uniref:Uncharacterized protein n=1 Tax=Rhizophora mucronata TaxID=61149 RepID=A0A2P2N2N3_RHIMU
MMLWVHSNSSLENLKLRFIQFYCDLLTRMRKHLKLAFVHASYSLLKRYFLCSGTRDFI